MSSPGNNYKQEKNYTGEKKHPSPTPPMPGEWTSLELTGTMTLTTRNVQIDKIDIIGNKLSNLWGSHTFF